MADVGTTTASATPNAAAMGVDGSLDDLAALIVQAQAAWDVHDGAALNDLLVQFWQDARGYSASSNLTRLDGYSHRLLAAEYQYQMAYANPADIPAILALQVEQLRAAIADWNACGATMQAANDGKILSQAQGWADQDASVWVDDSYTAAVKDVVNRDLAAAGSIIDAAGSALDLLKSPLVWIGLAAAAAFLLVKK